MDKTRQQYAYLFRLFASGDHFNWLKGYVMHFGDLLSFVQLQMYMVVLVERCFD